MPDFPPYPDEFLNQAARIIGQNLASEDFGVPELAEQLSMSRSTLLRKIKAAAGVSASVFIRQVRLRNARTLLQSGGKTVSEVAFAVGFNSTSYFVKCFREEFGITPGEALQQPDPIPSAQEPTETSRSWHPLWWIAAVVVILLAAAGGIWWGADPTHEPPVSFTGEKTIAVLPFENDSNDSSNVYIINGMMVSILDHLQKIEDLRVMSRTSVEKYRGSALSIPQLSQALGVRYFVEGSGQKVGNEILLTVRLIESASDTHIWSAQYRREIGDIFGLQTEIATTIAGEIEAVMTAEERKRIQTAPTDNLAAYDYYLQGQDFLQQESREGLLKAIDLFGLATEEDETFALAYAYTAIAYYYLDLFQTDKVHAELVNTFADKALLLAPELGESMIAKALYYMQTEDYELAVSYFEKVLDYYPHSVWTHNFLTNIYTIYLPNTGKYLQYAMAGIRQVAASQDSAEASNSYLHVGNALAQNGFLDEADTYIRRSLAFNPNNLFSQQVAVYVHLAQNNNYEAAREELIAMLARDTNRVDIIQEVAKVSYFMDDFATSALYYDRLLKSLERQQLDLYQSEYSKIAVIRRHQGKEEEAQQWMEAFIRNARDNPSVYLDLAEAAYFSFQGDINQGMQHLNAFSKQHGCQFWHVHFLDTDTLIRRLSGHPDYDKTVQRIRQNFQEDQEEMQEFLDRS